MAAFVSIVSALPLLPSAQETTIKARRLHRFFSKYLFTKLAASEAAKEIHLYPHLDLVHDSGLFFCCLVFVL